MTEDTKSELEEVYYQLGKLGSELQYLKLSLKNLYVAQVKLEPNNTRSERRDGLDKRDRGVL